MPKPKKASAAPQLEKLITVRLTAEDAELLAKVGAQQPLARPCAVAREALRRGLASMLGEAR